MTVHLCGNLMAWGNQLKKKKCIHLVKFLQRVFTYNLLPTTNHNELIVHMTYVIDAILNEKNVNIPSIIYHMMLKTAFVDCAIGSITFLILVIKIMMKEKVPFKSSATSRNCNPLITMGSLSEMGLLSKEGKKSKYTFKPNPTRSAIVNAEGTMMYLLNTLVRKITKVLKNQCRLTKNQCCLNTNQKAVAFQLSHATLDEPLLLASASENDESEDREDENDETFAPFTVGGEAGDVEDDFLGDGDVLGEDEGSEEEGEEGVDDEEDEDGGDEYVYSEDD